MEKNDTEMPPDTPKTTEARRKWKVKCGKMLFVMRTAINKELIDHIRDLGTPKDVWETLEKLFSKKNVAWLKLLENELASSVQGNLTIVEYFLKIKNLSTKLSELDLSEKISEARWRRYIIRGLKKEYSPFIMSIQRWTNQPSLEELQNFLTNQEAFLQQSLSSPAQETGFVLLFKGKTHSQDNEEAELKRKSVKC